jgi:hypothetical protein
MNNGCEHCEFMWCIYPIVNAVFMLIGYGIGRMRRKVVDK